MKVVIFCGGQGLRMRDYSDTIPKPMVPIGQRPVLWHSMRYFAHFGHREFVLCLGYRGEAIKQYFLQYDESISNDFVFADGGKSIELLNTDIQDWRVTFANTGLYANIGERLVAVRRHLEHEEVFLASYGDCVTDAPLDDILANFLTRDCVAAFLSVRPTYSFHAVVTGNDGVVTGLEHVSKSGMRINGGYFMFRASIFDYIAKGEELVEEPFQRLIAERQLVAYEYDGFWAPMDTLKDAQTLQALYDSGNPPWAVWRGDEGDGETP